jgi:outer membrane lipoprotein-sorting protein
MLLLPVLTGCLSHTRKLQQPKLAGNAVDADAVQLVQAINHRYDQIKSLTATVDFAASVGGAHKGKETDYTSLPGYIIFGKPQMLRVLGLVPVLRTHAFDLASDGQTFTLLIPPKSRAITGNNTVTKPAANPLENIRPSLFLDAILIREIPSDAIVSLTNSSVNTVDTRNKQLVETPQYDLTVLHPETQTKAQVQVYQAQRVIKFSRVDLMPMEQDIYDKSGDLETEIEYGPYQNYNGTPYPTTITISRPLEEYKIAVTVHEVKFNLTLPEGQFEQKVPPGYKVQKLQ